uniref:Uncharacterized protein n=1 Tax=Balaenoptera musculus TaxID=9771 RepID=A0A8C0DG79_BALMU
TIRQPLSSAYKCSRFFNLWLEQKLEICRHICGWSYSTTCTLCGLPQCVEKYSKCFIVWGVVTVSCNLDGLFFLGNIL